MRASSLLAVLSTLLMPKFAAADPIPIRASHAKLAVELGTHVLKRDEAKLFAKDGWGATYWAWSRVAYDSDWNSVDDTRGLHYEKLETKTGEMEDRKWVLLADNDNISIRGAVGAKLANAGFMWTSIETTQHAIVAVDKKAKEIVVAYQGTDNFWHLLQDAKANKHEFKGVPGKAHLGFGECFEALEGSVTRFLRTLLEVEEYQSYPIVFAGHSLGGATALIAAAYYTGMWPSIVERTWVFTYGSPNSGNDDFQFYLEKTLGSRMYNFRHTRDPIPLMPTVTEKWVWGDYANPAGRYVFEPDSDNDSWFDKDKWQHHPTVDHEGQGYSSSTYVLAKGYWDNGLLWHTGYFQDDQVRAKRQLPADAITYPVHEQQKRDAPSTSDLQLGSDLIKSLTNGRELTETPRYAPGPIWRMAKPLRFEHDEEKLWETIKELPDKETRTAFLFLVFLAACNLK